jgi:hypothetical protein
MPFYEDYEQEAEKIRSENEVLLKGFRKWLEQSGLKEKTMPIRLAPKMVGNKLRHSRHTSGCAHVPSQRPVLIGIFAPHGNPRHAACSDRRPDPCFGRQPDRH